MKVINKEELKRRLLQNSKSVLSCARATFIAAWEDKYGTSPEDDDIEAVQTPDTVYNAYWKNGDQEGIVGVSCHILYANQGGPHFKVDLAIETNVPGFFTIHEDVKVVFMEPADGGIGDTIHLAEADYAKEIERISMAAGPAE